MEIAGARRPVADRHGSSQSRNGSPTTSRAASSADALLGLQRSAGNAAVASLLTVQRDDPKEEPRETKPDATDADQGNGEDQESDGGVDSGWEYMTGEPGPSKDAEEAEHVDPDAAKDAGKDEKTTPQTVAPKPAGPSFTRDPGCDIEAPALPTVPPARTFAPDPKATLPPREVAPDLSMIPQDKPWWDDAAAKAFGDKLADCYATRGMTSGEKVDKADKLAKLQVDFDQVVRAWFGRTGYGRWDQAPAKIAQLLQLKRGKLMDAEKAVDAKKKKDDRRSQADLDAAVETQMQRVRFDVVEDVRAEVAKGTWGWMAERREKLDFDTIAQKPKGTKADLAELLTDTERRAVVHQVLVDRKKEITAGEVAAVHAAAQRAADAANKKAGKPEVPLTVDEKAAAVAKAERDRVTQLKLGGDLQTAMIKARTVKDDANLLVPTKTDVGSWTPDLQKTHIHKDIVAMLKVLEKEFPAGFSCGTYYNNVEGDHASGGFEGRFRSLDMYPTGGASRIHKPFGELGFFDKQIAFDFAMAIDRAVNGKGSYQILYNDFPVARELNKVLKNGQMFNIDNVSIDAAGPKNLNWHGPLVTHFHVDFAI